LYWGRRAGIFIDFRNILIATLVMLLDHKIIDLVEWDEDLALKGTALKRGNHIIGDLIRDALALGRCLIKGIIDCFVFSGLFLIKIEGVCRIGLRFLILV